MKELSSEIEQDSLEGIVLNQAVSYQNESGWIVCALDKRPGIKKPFGIIRAGHGSNQRPAETKWVSRQDIK